MATRLEQVSPNSANYMRGGTRVYVRRTADAGYINLGNVVTSQLTRNADVKEHITGYDGVRTVDRRFIDVKSIDFTIKTDENTFQNISLWLSGGATTASTRAAVTDTTRDLNTLFGTSGTSTTPERTALLGRWFDIGSGLHGLASGSLWAGASPVPLVEGTDYLIDLVAGKVCLLLDPGQAAFDAGYVHYALLELDKQVFTKVSFTELDVYADGWYNFEDSQVRDHWYVPKARLEPSGNADVSIENPRELEFKLIQLRDTVLAWGTFERYQVADA